MNPKNLQPQSRLVLLVLTACIILAAAQPTTELPPDGKSPGSSDPTLQHCEVPWSRSSNNNDIIIDMDTNETSSTPVDSSYNFITTNFGTKVANTDTSLKAGPRGPTLMEDFHFREKLTHFDHERIPERVVHARGFGAHGYFQVYEPLADLTSASFLQDPSKKTPVFVRFSTVLGSRGSADTVRDIRGFATKFYTDSGNFDLVGNDIPVFFIQDAIKFPDLVHSAKPEPHHDIPQASTAHDNFWDFVSLVPQTLHTVMWVLSDRGIPRSFRMMPGFGVNTFVLVNGTGHRKFVKFHWLPVLGVHSLVWDEAQQLAGIDSDFHRRDLWEAIANGQYPEWELGLQIVDESDEDSFDFDLLDATKIIPEESVPVIRVGRMVLNRNVDNFFDETEQVAFHVGHLVPGIEPSHDPLFQGRLFSYVDTQLIRLGGPNFEQIPINQPVAPVLNNQRQGYHRIIRDKGTVNYYPNRFGCPMLASVQQGAYEFRSIGLSGVKTRDTGPKFFEYFNQSRLFYNSLTGWEKQHLTDAAIFELGNVEDFGVRSRVVDLFKQVDCQFADTVAKGIGVPSPLASGNATCRTDDIQSPPLSQNNTVKNTILSRRLAILVGEGYNYQQLWWMTSFLTGNGAMPFVVGPVKGPVASNNGGEDDQGTENVQTVNATFSFATAKSVMFDGVVVVGGQASIDFLSRTGNAKRFVTEAFKHGKPIVGLAEGVDFISELPITVSISPDQAQHEIMGVVTWRGFGASNSTSRTQFANTVFTAIASHRHPEREVASVP